MTKRQDPSKTKKRIMSVGYPEYSINAVNELKVTMVNRLKKRKDVTSLWGYFFPDVLAHSREVICLKWFQGKATLFDQKSFTNLISFFESGTRIRSLSPGAKLIFDYLEDTSPHSTKEIKQATDMVGPNFTKSFNVCMKELWQIGLIVSWGQVDKAAFPSTAVGSSRQLFEECWKGAEQIAPAEAEEFLKQSWGEENPFFKFAQKLKKQRQ